MSFRYFGILAAASLLAACAGNSGSFIVNGLAPDAAPNGPAPAPCNGQKTTPKYATVHQPLLINGVAVCVPAFDGFGGGIYYPTTSKSAELTLISSTTNYNNKLPPLHSGTPLFYMQFALSAGTTFGANTEVGGGLQSDSQNIVPSKPYTAYAKATSGHIVSFAPCYAIAKTWSVGGGQIPNLGRLFQGLDFPEATKGVVEIFRGKFTAHRC